MNTSSQNQRDKEKIAKLLADARKSLAEKGLLKIQVPPDLPKEVDKVPDIHDPTKNRADFQKDIDAQILAKTREFHEEQRRLREAKQKELDEELAKIKAQPRPKIDFNEEQQRAIDLGISGESFCLIGKAGTGKTTTARELIQILREQGKIGPIAGNTKYLRHGLPGVAIVSFTNRAVKNIARGMPADLKQHCLTVHKLLEFQPEKVLIKDANGEMKESMRFLPARNARNPLPPELKCIMFEESSMISTDLFAQLMDALPHECQMIFLGDLQQLPPVYGMAILGFKLLELPVVELTKIYRQAEGSPIISLAWKVASGEVIPASEFPLINANSDGKILMKPWKKRLEPFAAMNIMRIFFQNAIDAGQYNPNEDMIMIPYNKSFGTIEFNKNLAQYLGKKRDATVFEIIAGFQKHYFAVGDKVLVERQEAIIEAINYNDMYKGYAPQMPDKRMNRWGLVEVEKKEKDRELTPEEQKLHEDEVDEFLLKQAALDKEQNEEAKQQASHILVCRLLDSDEILEVRTTGEYSSCIFAYALTVHKCQGSEWRKCFLLLHNSHATMLQRELLYTAITRAREELCIICEPESFVKGVANQRIKGNSIAEKAEFFKGKLEKELM